MTLKKLLKYNSLLKSPDWIFLCPVIEIWLEVFLATANK